MSVKAPTTKKPADKSRKASSKSKPGRLAPGELDKLVLGYMRRHKKDAPYTPSAIGKAIKRSSGAVANCLERQESRRRCGWSKPSRANTSWSSPRRAREGT
jgi:hypothetical protein